MTICVQSCGFIFTKYASKLTSNTLKGHWNFSLARWKSQFVYTFMQFSDWKPPSHPPSPTIVPFRRIFGIESRGMQFGRHFEHVRKKNKLDPRVEKRNGAYKQFLFRTKMHSGSVEGKYWRSHALLGRLSWDGAETVYEDSRHVNTKIDEDFSRMLCANIWRMHLVCVFERWVHIRIKNSIESIESKVIVVTMKFSIWTFCRIFLHWIWIFFLIIDYLEFSSWILIRR